MSSRYASSFEYVGGVEKRDALREFERATHGPDRSLRELSAS